MVILAMRYAIETSGLMVITAFIDLTLTTMVYRLAYMKKSGNRLSRCPDFVIHYNTQSLALKHTYEVYFGYDRTLRKYGRFRQKLPVKKRCSPQTGDRAKPANRRGSAMDL